VPEAPDADSAEPDGCIDSLLAVWGVPVSPHPAARRTRATLKNWLISHLR
jgi:hypothetical protein